MQADQDEKVRENRVRRVAARRGYELRKSRRRDPLAVDYGHWYLTRGSINGMATGRVTGFDDLDAVEAFLDAILGPVERGQS